MGCCESKTGKLVNEISKAMYQADDEMFRELMERAVDEKMQLGRVCCYFSIMHLFIAHAYNRNFGQDTIIKFCNIFKEFENSYPILDYSSDPDSFFILDKGILRLESEDLDDDPFTAWFLICRRDEVIYLSDGLEKVLKSLFVVVPPEKKRIILTIKERLIQKND